MLKSYVTQDLNTFNFHRFLNTFLKTDFIFLKKYSKLFVINPLLRKKSLTNFFFLLKGYYKLNYRSKLSSFFCFSQFFKSDLFFSKILKLQQNIESLSLSNLNSAYFLYEEKKLKMLNLLFSQKTKFEFVFWFQFIKKMYFNTDLNGLLTDLDSFDSIERSFLKRVSGKFVKKPFIAGRSFKDFQTSVKDRIYNFVKRHRVKKRSKFLSHLFDVNIDFLRAKEVRLPESIRGVVPYKYVSKKKSSSYIFWHMEKFYYRFLFKMLKLTKSKKKSLKIFSFLRKLNFFKAKKRSIKTGKQLKKNQFLSEISLDALPDDRLQFLARYRQSVKFFYLLRKLKNKSNIKPVSENLTKKKKENNQNIFNFLLWCKKLKNYQKISSLSLEKNMVLLRSGHRFVKIFKKNRIFFKLRKVPLNFLDLTKKNDDDADDADDDIQTLQENLQKNFKEFEFLFKKSENLVKNVEEFNNLNPSFSQILIDLSFEDLQKFKDLQKKIEDFRNDIIKGKEEKKMSVLATKDKKNFFKPKNYKLFSYRPVTKQVLFLYLKKKNKHFHKNKIQQNFLKEQVLNSNFCEELLPLKKTNNNLAFFFSQLRSRLDRLVLGHANPTISNYISKIIYPTVDLYPQNSYQKIESKPTILSFSSKINNLMSDSFKFFGCFKTQQMLNQMSGLVHSFDCSFFNLKFFNFLAVGFLSLINLNVFNSVLNERFGFYLQNLISYKKHVSDELKSFIFYRQYWENITHPEFWLNKNKRSPFISPGMIIFTLNSNSVFLTVLNNAGYTVFQTSTGAVNKKKYSHEKIRKVVVRGYRARREVYKRMLQKLFKRVQAIRSKKTRRAKRKQLVGFIKKQGKKGKKRKGNKLRKLPKGKTFYLTFTIVRKMLSLLNPIVNYMQTYISHNNFFKVQVLRKKLQLKLDKLKMSKKFNSKAFYLLLKRIKSLNLKRKYKKHVKRVNAYFFIGKKQGHTYVQRRIKNLISFFPNENLQKKKIKQFLAKQKRKKNQNFFSYNFKQNFLNFWLNQKQNKKEKLQFVLKSLCLRPFRKNLRRFGVLNYPKVVSTSQYKNQDTKKEQKNPNLGKFLYVLSEKYTKDLFKNLSQGKISRKTFKISLNTNKKGRFHRWYRLQTQLKNSYQTWVSIKNLTAKRLTRYLLLFKHIDDSMIRRAFKYLLTKFFEKIGKNRLAFDQKVTKLGISSLFYYLVKQKKQNENISSSGLHFYF